MKSSVVDLILARSLARRGSLPDDESRVGGETIFPLSVPPLEPKLPVCCRNSRKIVKILLVEWWRGRRLLHPAQGKQKYLEAKCCVLNFFFSSTNNKATGALTKQCILFSGGEYNVTIWTAACFCSFCSFFTGFWQGYYISYLGMWYILIFRIY